MNGTEDVKSVFYEALGKTVGDKMHKGANAWDLLQFFKEVKKRNLKQGRKIQFKLRKQAGVVENIAINDFNVMNGLDRCTDRVGNYLMFGKSKRSTDLYKALLKVLSRVDDKEKLVRWGKIADGSKPMDHAVGVSVRVDGTKFLYDNGFMSGSKEYSIYNLADRMCDISLCYAVDLWEE